MKRLACAIALLFIPLTATAWTRASDQRIAKKAAQLAPADMKLVLQRFEPEFNRGLERAESDEGSEMHHYFVLSREGKLRERIEQETRGIVTLLRKRESMAIVVEHLGILAHLVADANNPFHTSDHDAHASPARDDFQQYFERRMAKFATMFYGVDRNIQLGSYLDRIMTRSSKLAPLLHEEYFRGGETHTSAEFDDRSTAFGVASVSYSHAVTDLANLYYYIWREAGGDVRAAAQRRPGLLKDER